MQLQKFETWDDMLVWMGGLKRFDRGPFQYSGSRWTQYYRLSKGAETSTIRAYGTGDSTTGLIEPKFIVAFAKKGGKTKKKVLHGLAAYLAFGVKARHEIVKHKFREFNSRYNLVANARMNKRVEELSEENALEMASWETESEEV